MTRQKWAFARLLEPEATRDARAEATSEVDWWDWTRAEQITITITITRLVLSMCESNYEVKMLPPYYCSTVLKWRCRVL